MGALDGRVVFITGAARGQGRASALLFARAGARILAVDIAADIETVGYALSTPDDLDETVRLVEAEGGEIVARTADVRDRAALEDAVAAGMSRFGRLDFVLCNAGVFAWTSDRRDEPQAWTDTMDVNTRGTYNAIEAALPAMLDSGNGGSIVITNSLAGIAPMLIERRFRSAAYMSYMASKHGSVGLMRAYALMLADASIRVNSLHPGGVSTPMIANESVDAIMAEMGSAIVYSPVMPIQRLEPEDVANASLWLCTDAARYITGTVLPIDGGAMLR
jgi:SDR family mycofactocin-dependent oxidoreductase